MTATVSRYIWQIYHKEIQPTLSSWIIFFSGTSLSLVTYAIAQDKDFKSGILNLVDCIGVALIMISVLLWSRAERHFRPFEKWYLAGIGLIVIYGLATGDAWSSNLFTWGLIATGYFPTIQTLVTEKRNTESFTAWGGEWITVTIGLYPASDGGNTLAILYASRGVVLIGPMLILMSYYEFQSRKQASAAL